jgi:tetratricopeptide (TPR) repeat protein
VIRLFVIPVLAMAIAAVPATAQSSVDDHNQIWQQCDGNNPDISIAACTKLIEIHVYDTFAELGLAFVNRGNAYASKGDLDRAIQDYDEAIRRRPGSAPAFNNRGEAYARKGDYDRAIADFTHAIELKPAYVFGHTNDPTFNPVPALNNRGAAYRNKGDYDHAISDFNEAIQRDPTNPEAFYSRGITYASKGDYDHAIADLDEAIRLKPSFAEAFYSRGNAYSDKHDYDHAIADFNEAIRRNPAYSEAFINRGSAYSKKGDYDRAIADFGGAIRLHPADSEALDNRGIAFSNHGDFALAIEDFSASLRLNPKDATALYGRGVAKQATNDSSAAAIDIAAAKQIDPAVAGRFVMLVTSAAPAGGAGTPAACKIPSDSERKSLSGVSTPSYVDDPVEQLKAEVPALRGIRLEASRSATNDSSAGQDQSASILSQTGAGIAAQFNRMPNLIAKEEVKQPTASSSDPTGSPSSKLSGSYKTTWQHPPGTLGTSDTSDRTRVFTYRLVPREDSASGHFVDEYRRDAHNQPLSDSDKNAESPSSVGFGASWLLFLPANLQQSHFRYLGQQKIRGHETYVLAFAQIPGRIRQGLIVDSPGGSCSSLIQGVVWIDRTTFQIVHLQTDLLWPVSSIHLFQLRSVLDYSEVKILERNLMLWLPSDVETTWQTAYEDGDELHKYSNYKLFGATSRILRPDEVPTH